ncbi:MAG: FtsQ-type POTRA domain-containing protein [Candidatus Eremiobacteraeota bacterium]|nr:FtsQ-type POTRA domain-containing protein [Candidatus Eremiobacteraeota bacterium]MBC5826679.1 FtsQ-type POTRA domain-containing protein [Candidatus Eremiobacteraeota bacterium]
MRALRRTCGAVLAAGLAYAAGWAGMRETADPRFALQTIAVSGARRTGALQVISAAALPRGQNIWLLRVGPAEARIRALPWILAVTISRGWPNRVSISVSERVPVARIVLAPSQTAEEPVARYALIDSSLRVLALEDASPSAPSAALPAIAISPTPGIDWRAGTYAGGAAAQALLALRRLSSLGVRATRVAVAPATGISITLDGKGDVLFGTLDDFAKKVALVQTIAPRINHPERVVYIDVRSVRAPTVLYR